jgi:hypothetical protein
MSAGGADQSRLVCPGHIVLAGATGAKRQIIEGRAQALNHARIGLLGDHGLEALDQIDKVGGTTARLAHNILLAMEASLHALPAPTLRRIKQHPLTDGAI